ncbi:MAG: hypothetical protein RMM58_05690 [Chloroflexota bacterium]|nr:hypothetical protein [Dehalococcoidia bacterium]MDW8253353.1 hypothetical protein [Chloroflexota bacterium]
MEQSEETTARFAIDVAGIENSGRSFEAMVEQRLCAAARRRLGDLGEEQPPLERASSGAAKLATQRAPFRSLELIQRFCADDVDYLRPDLPILEACFRLFLLNGNTPLTIAQLREELEHWPSFADRVRPLSDAQLIDMLTRDRYYGIRRVSE